MSWHAIGTFEMRYQDMTFGAEDVVDVDGNVFERCNLNRCVLVYRGGPAPTITNCRGSPRLRFEGPAKNTQAFISEMWRPGSGMAEFAALLFPELQRKPLVGYKFLRSDDAHYIEQDHTIRIATLSYYRDMHEQAGGKDQIGDDLEGVAKNVHDPIVAKHLSDEQREVIEAFGVSIDQQSEDITFTDNTMLDTYQDVFVFCYSVGDYESLASAFNTYRNGGYDACFRLNDLRELAHLIWNGTIRELSGTKVSSAFSEIRGGDVEYEKRVANITRERPIVGDPLKKDIKFSEQSEARIIFFPKKRITQKVLTIDLGDLDNLVIRHR